MKIYIAGKITGLKNHKEIFKKAEDKLKSWGNVVLNPSILPPGFEQSEYMKICFAMIDVCEIVFFLNNWEDSIGAKKEFEYAIENNKRIEFEIDYM